MKTTDSLQDALQIAHLAEGTMHSEELSKQYLDTVKKDSQVDSIQQGKGNPNRSWGHGHVTVDVAKGHLLVASKTQVVLSQEDLVATVVPNTLQSQCPAFRKSCYYCKKEGHFSKFCCTRAHSQSQQHKKKDMNDLENEALYPEQFHSFDFEQDSFNTIYFRKNLKGSVNSNILFDEIDGLEHVLTDLHIQGASNLKDYRPVGKQYRGPVLKCRFKVDSGATGNLLPYNVFCKLFPGMPDSVTKNSIDHRVHLVAYNKGEIKQYGCCIW